MFQYGAGAMFALPLSTLGNPATNPTPQMLGTLQDVDLEISIKNVELMGSNQFPDDVAPGDIKITGKAKFGRLDINLYNNLLFGQTVTTGYTGQAVAEAHAVPASTPFTVTITPPSSGTFSQDEGVQYASTGARLTRVTSAPTQGQYSVSAGVYTFAAADTGVNVLISYNYTVAASGQTLTIANKAQGFGPAFEVYLFQGYQGQNGIHLYACRSSKLAVPLKRDNYQIAEIDFTGYANPAGKVMDWFQTAA